MGDSPPKWASAWIGKNDMEWYEEWSTYYAAEDESAVIKRHMQWGKTLDELFDEFGVEISEEFSGDFRLRMRSCLEKLAEESG